MIFRKSTKIICKEIIKFDKCIFHSCVKLADIKVQFENEQPRECNLLFNRCSLHGCEDVIICGQKSIEIYKDAEEISKGIRRSNNYIFADSVFCSQDGDKK